MILRNIKIAATRCHILKLKCTKFDFGRGSAPAQTPLGELTALPQTSCLDLRGLLIRGKREGQERAGEGPKGRGEGWTGKGEGQRRDRGNGREGKENGDRPPTIFGSKVALQ